MLAVAVLIVVVRHWRIGALAFAAAALYAAALRIVLPTRRAGLIAVRHRTLDVAILMFLAVVIATLALVVPPQGP